MFIAHLLRRVGGRILYSFDSSAIKNVETIKILDNNTVIN
jgi:hypothetical protein